MKLYGFTNAVPTRNQEMRKLTEYEQGRFDALAGKHPYRFTTEYARGYDAGLAEIRCGLL